MSLSDHDQEIFAQMEKQFNADRKTSPLLKSPKKPKINKARATVLGILAIVAGIAVLVFGVALAQMWLGILGFLVMFSGGLLLANGFIVPVDHDRLPKIK